MTTDTDVAYLAGLIDGEGCIRVKRTKAYKHLTGRVNPSYGISIHVRMVEEPAIAFLKHILGGWYYAEKTTHASNGRPLFCWQATDTAAAGILKRLLPYLRVKKAQAENALALREWQADSRQHKTKITGYRNFPNKYGTPRQVPNYAYTDEYIAKCDTFFTASRHLNRVGAR